MAVHMSPIHNGQAPTANQIGASVEAAHPYNRIQAAQGSGKLRRTHQATYCSECGRPMTAADLTNGNGRRCETCWKQLTGFRMR